MKIRRKKEMGETPASAMSDIAFLLIVFFMVIAVFSVKEGFIIITPEKEKVIQKASNDILKIYVSESDYFISNEKVEKEKLKEQLKEKKKNKRFVVIEIESKAKYKRVIYVLDLFAKLKILDFSMRMKGANT